MLCKNIKYSKILSSCHLPIPLFSVYHCMRRNIGKLLKTSFFHRKIQRFFSAKVWFSEGLRCILGWGFCRSPMRFFSNNENMVGGSLIQHCEFSMKILRLTMKSWGLQWLFGDGFFFGNYFTLGLQWYSKDEDFIADSNLIPI